MEPVFNPAIHLSRPDPLPIVLASFNDVPNPLEEQFLTVNGQVRDGRAVTTRYYKPSALFVEGGGLRGVCCPVLGEEENSVCGRSVSFFSDIETTVSFQFVHHGSNIRRDEELSCRLPIAIGRTTFRWCVKRIDTDTYEGRVIQKLDEDERWNITYQVPSPNGVRTEYLSESQLTGGSGGCDFGTNYLWVEEREGGGGHWQAEPSLRVNVTRDGALDLLHQYGDREGFQRTYQVLTVSPTFSVIADGPPLRPLCAMCQQYKLDIE